MLYLCISALLVAWRHLHMSLNLRPILQDIIEHIDELQDKVDFTSEHDSDNFFHQDNKQQHLSEETYEPDNHGYPGYRPPIGYKGPPTKYNSSPPKYTHDSSLLPDKYSPAHQPDESYYHEEPTYQVPPKPSYQEPTYKPQEEHYHKPAPKPYKEPVSNYYPPAKPVEYQPPYQDSHQSYYQPEHKPTIPQSYIPPYQPGNIFRPRAYHRLAV